MVDRVCRKQGSLGLWFLSGVLVMAACRPDPGNPDYSDHVGLREAANARNEVLPGSNPYRLGQQRLYLGSFYEGGRSDEILINGVDTNYFIFERTYSQEVDGERIEGLISDVIILNGTPWWGGGIIWNNARDLSDWTTMSISLRSSDEGFADFEVRMQFEAENGDVVELALPVSEYGFINDGMWHTLKIPLADFTGLDLSMIRSPLILGGTGGASGEQLFVDDLYMTDE